MDIMVYSPFGLIIQKKNVKQLIQISGKNFILTTWKKLCMQGYEIAFYFMSGLAMHGKSFIKHPEIS